MFIFWTKALISGPVSVALRRFTPVSRVTRCRGPRRVPRQDSQTESSQRAPGGPHGRALPEGRRRRKKCHIFANICPKIEQKLSAFKCLPNLEKAWTRMPWEVLEKKRAVLSYLL